MIAYLCNHCKKPIDFEKDKKDCVHLEISYGEKAVINKGKYADGWSADLCSECFEKIAPLIDENYYSGNKYLKGGANE